jgi:hypothetical protein
MNRKARRCCGIDVHKASLSACIRLHGKGRRLTSCTLRTRRTTIVDDFARRRPSFDDCLVEQDGFEPPVPVVRSEVASSCQFQFLRHDRRRA